MPLPEIDRKIGADDHIADPRCVDGWAHAFIQWSNPNMDPATALYEQDDAGAWVLANTGTDVLWDCSERELLDGLRSLNRRLERSGERSRSESSPSGSSS